MPETKSINIFIAYAHADEAFLRPLRKHLAVLEDDGVSIWYDGEILPGEEWDVSIKKRLKAADIILLLVSIDFLTSDYVKGTELPTALSRHGAGECTVVPVIVRNCLWQKKLGNLQALPKEAFPVENWSSRDSAYHNVVEGLDRMIQVIKNPQAAKERAKKENEENERHYLTKLLHGSMVFIKGGNFEMGSKDHDSSKPIHNVNIPDFYICKYPVTQAQWKMITGNNPSHFNDNDNYPVDCISWYNAKEFIKKLNAKTGQKYRLPTESEWEYAARGGSKTNGFKYAGSNNLNEVGWYANNSNRTPSPVGRKKPNELGLFDMSGSVEEWCEDIWHDNYKGAPIDGSARMIGKYEYLRVSRGGSRNNYDDYNCSVHRRSGFHWANENGPYGFRLAHDSPM